MHIKICGLCRPVDAEAAVKAGADHVGVILAPRTRRSQSLAAAAAIFAAAGSARRVGVFVDAPPAEVEQAVRALSLSVVQLHGSESAEQVTALTQLAEVWKAVRVREPADLLGAAQVYRSAAALLLDAYHPQQAGGTGVRLDWQALAATRFQLPMQLRIVLAGGLTPDNVGEAIRMLAPAVVDVSSGVERAPGQKSADLMTAFVRAAHEVRPNPIKA